MSKLAKSIVSIVSVVIYWLVYELTLPPLSVAYFSGFCFIAFGVILLAVNVMVWLASEDDCVDEFKWWIPLIVFALVIVISIICGIGSTALFHDTQMYEQIGEIEGKSFTEDIVEIDNSQIPIVDIPLAEKLADKKLGEDLALGSMAKVGEFTNKQAVNGKLIYIAPLEHRGFWKWNKNKTGTTGYVEVSATNTSDVKLVQKQGDKPIKLKYLQSAYFGSDLKRYLRNNGYRSAGLTEYTFEKSDDGGLYWVITKYENTTLWRNPEATGIVILDAQTGEIEEYSVEDAPAWVDIIQPEGFISKQLENYGSLVHGWFNPSEKDELTVTPHITTVYNNGECYYYTGMSSAGADEGTVGFVMVNSRNKAAVMYRMSGATEAAAMRSIEGAISEKGYTSTTPIPLNVSGIPTYFCTLKDAEGLVKAYGMINMSNYEIAKTASTIQEVKRLYISAVNSSGNSQNFSGDEAYGYSTEGIVTRIGSNIESGNTYYYMILNNNPSQIFLASYSLSEELPLTREGDKVKVTYVDEKATGSVNLVAFDNIDFNLKEVEKSNIIEMENNNITKVDPDANQKAWDELTDEEKSKLLESIE